MVNCVGIVSLSMEPLNVVTKCFYKLVPYKSLTTLMIPYYFNPTMSEASIVAAY